MCCDEISLAGFPRESPYRHSNGAWLNLKAGRLLGGPYAQGHGPCIFAVRRSAANCDRPPANCVYFMNLESEESKKGLSHVRQSLFLCYFRQHGGNLESSPVFVFPLDEQQPEQLPQQLAVPLNRPRIWWMKYATAMMTTIATIMVAGLIEIPPLGISNYSL